MEVVGYFKLWSLKIIVLNEQVEMMQAFRQIASESPFGIVFYHPLFPFFDQFAEVFIIQYWKLRKICFEFISKNIQS